jgi:hypothetical protein
MWWSQEEEDLQKQYIAAWGEAADDDIADLAADDDIADLAADFADLAAAPPDPPDGDLDLGGEAEAAEAAEEGGPPAAFQWHLPEGVPLPVPDLELPLVNGFHIFLPPLNLHQGGADAH